MDLLSFDFFQDPYRFYRFLRREDPAHLTKQGCLLLTRHSDINDALSNPKLGNAPSDFAITHPRNADRFVCASVASGILPFLDGADHAFPRKVVASTLRSCFEKNPPALEETADRIVAACLEKGTFDVLADLGRPLGLRAICGFMGLPAGDERALLDWTRNFFRLFAPMPGPPERQQIDIQLTGFRDYFRELVARRRAQPGEDLVSALLSREIDGKRLTDAQVIDNCMLIFADAIENVDAALASALLALDRNPREHRKLRADRGLVPAAVEETLRFDAPAQMIPRVAKDDFPLHGKSVRRNDVVFLALGSANRDPEAFPEPDRFTLSRPVAAHLGFGKGRHSCLGAFFVRAEMAAALGSLLAKSRSIRIHDENPVWECRPGHRWLKSLTATILSH